MEKERASHKELPVILRALDYDEGYRKALMDMHSLLSKWEPSFRADRKRNNVRNVKWLLEAILDDPDTFANYNTETPIYYREDGKQLKYYINYNEWPVSVGEKRT